MIDIYYKGANYIVLQTKRTTLVVDPVVPGIKSAKMLGKANVQLLTQSQFRAEATEDQRVFSIPGEYEIGDFSVTGVDTASQLNPEVKSVMYRIASPDCTVAILGHVNPDTVSEEALEALGVIDVLVVPVGGNGFTVDSHGAAKLTKRMSPKVVIPVHFDDGDTPYEVPQQSLDDFIKELGIEPQKEQAFKIKQAGQLPQTLTMVVLEKTAP